MQHPFLAKPLNSLYDGDDSRIWGFRILTQPELEAVRLRVAKTLRPSKFFWSQVFSGIPLLSMLASALTLGYLVTQANEAVATTGGLIGTFTVMALAAYAFILLFGGVAMAGLYGVLQYFEAECEPLQRLHNGCSQTLQMAKDSPACKAYREQVIANQREFVIGDHTVMALLLAKERQDAYAASEKSACSALHGIGA